MLIGGGIYGPYVNRGTNCWQFVFFNVLRSSYGSSRWFEIQAKVYNNTNLRRRRYDDEWTEDSGMYATCHTEYSCCPEVSYLKERGHQLILPLRRMSLDIFVSSLYQVAHFWTARVVDFFVQFELSNESVMALLNQPRLLLQALTIVELPLVPP